MRSLLLSFLAIIGVFAGSATAAPPPAPPTLDGGVYQVHVVIEAGGRVIASPTVTLLAGSEVVTAYSGLADGPMPGYALRLTLDQVSGSPNGAMQIHSEIYAPQGGQWVSMGTPGVRSAVGGTARFQSAERTPYGDGGWSISYTVTKTDLVRSASDVGSLSDCPMYQQLGATPLPGVRVFGTKQAVNVALQTNDGPTAGNCCTDGPMTCCGTPGDGVCCDDGRGHSCCAPR